MARYYGICLLITIVAARCVSQHSIKKQAPKLQPPFVCPDPEAKQGCKSYQELIVAKDKTLPDNNHYVCFRKGVDEFFVVSLPPKRDIATNLPASGYANSYKNGVDNSSTPPNFIFTGVWNQYGFSSTQINFKDKEENDTVTGVYINENQFSVSFKYPNQTNDIIVYSLTIQRSTGRFAESFKKDAEHIAFLESTGRCVYRK